MGTSNQWKAIETDVKSLFPIESWMLNFTKDYHFELTQSVWNWESGFSTWHTVDQAEEIRDHNMRAIYSNWAYIKHLNLKSILHINYLNYFIWQERENLIG